MLNTNLIRGLRLETVGGLDYARYRTNPIQDAWLYSTQGLAVPYHADARSSSRDPICGEEGGTG